MTENFSEDDIARQNAEDYAGLAAQGRRRAREAALLMLYQLDFGANEPQMATRTLADIGLEGDGAAFALNLTQQAHAFQEQADALVTSLSREWEFERLYSVDVAILRLALSELQGETPANIVINEAVELAKKFGDESSPAFINAVMDAAYKRLRLKEQSP